MTRTRNIRTGFTLVELLAAMGVVIVLAGIAAMVVPGAVSQDRTTDGAALTRLYLTTAKNRAARDGQPRGLRLIVTADPTIPTKNPLWVTDVQEIESPLVLVVNGNQTTTFNVTTPPATGLASPCVRVLYTIFYDAMNPNNPSNGVITNRQLFIQNLTTEQQLALPGAMLGVPEFSGYWCRINRLLNAATGEVELLNTAGGVQAGNTTPTTYPDEYMGGSASALSYRFGIYATPQTLMASTTLPLPKNICIDLSQATGPAATPTYPYTEAPSRPQGAAGLNYDILFAPNGQVINGIGRPVVDGQMFLWVRDYTKAVSPLVVLGQSGGLNVYDMNVFRTAGEQQIVALKTKSGAMGVFPVTWPVEVTGSYAPGQNPYSFAQLGATGP